jgi:hypothetical protein
MVVQDMLVYDVGVAGAWRRNRKHPRGVILTTRSTSDCLSEIWILRTSNFEVGRIVSKVISSGDGNHKQST